MSERDPLFDRLDDAIDFLIETGNGSAQDDLPDWAIDEGVQLLIDARERIRAVPAIILLPPEERPTEPGTYVVHHNEQNGFAEIFHREGRLVAWLMGSDEEWLLDEMTFIARIYPDRIEGREVRPLLRFCRLPL